MKIETRMDCDRQSCEQMRDSGWSEHEIKEFMENNKGFYFENEKDMEIGNDCQH